MFVYMSLELGGGGDEDKNKALMCLMFAVHNYENHMRRVWVSGEGAAGEEAS